MNFEERLESLEADCRKLQTTVSRLKRWCTCLLAMLVCLAGVAAGKATQDGKFDTLTAREIHVAAPDSPYGMLFHATKKGAGILLSKDGNQAPEQMISIAVGGKDQAAIGLHAHDFSIMVGGGCKIRLEDRTDLKNVKTKEIVAE